MFKNLYRRFMTTVQIFSFLLIFTPHAAGQGAPIFQDLTIIVNSCDKYADLWDPFFKLLYAKWPSLNTVNKHVPIILISNRKSYSDPRVVTINIPNETSWSDTMIEVLSKVKTKYVLILLEDYFVDSFNEGRFFEVFQGMAQEKAAYMQIFPDSNENEKRTIHPTLKNVAYKNKFETFRTSLQACMWDKDALRHILKETENIWEFEIAGSTRSQGMMAPYLALTGDYPINYLNMTQGGFLNAENLMKAEKLGVTVNTKTIPIDADHQLYLWWKRNFLPFLYWDVWVPIKQAIKSL